jgi:hypothetical protein
MSVLNVVKINSLSLDSLFVVCRFGIPSVLEYTLKSVHKDFCFAESPSGKMKMFPFYVLVYPLKSSL